MPRRSPGRVDPLIGRQLEVQRTIEILCRRRKNNPLYVGEAGRRQDRDRRGPRAPRGREEGPGRAGRLHDLRARHGRPDRGHEVPRRLREAAQGRRQRTEEEAGRDPLHRRDPHRHRRGRGVRRRDGRLEPDQAGAGERRAALHRLDHLPGIPRYLREGSRTRAALPEDRRGRADGRGDDRHPARPQDALRGAPRHHLRGRCTDRRRGARRAPHQRPPPARQGDRRRGRGGRFTPAQAGGGAREPR